MIGKSRSKKNDNKKEEVKGLPSFVDNKKIEEYDAKKDKLIILERKKKKFNLKSIAIISCIILILATAIFMLKFIDFDVTEMLWRVSLTRNSDEINNKSVKYESFKNGMVRISNDGITFINSHGEVKWTISYNMEEPIYVTREKYFAISDRNAFESYIFDENGLLGKNINNLPIQKISLSENGTLYILSNDENDSYINISNINNNIKKDIAIKGKLKENGIPIDISVSKDGEKLVVDYVDLADKDIYSKVVYYDFSDENIIDIKVLKEYTNEIKDKFIAKVHFFDNEKSCIVHDKGVIFIDALSQDGDANTSEFLYENNIKSISYNEDFFAMIFDDGRFVVCNKTGDVLTDKKIDFEYDNFYIDDDYIIFLMANRSKIYDVRGRVLFDRDMANGVEYIVKKKSLFFTELLIGLIDGVECVRFY